MKAYKESYHTKYSPSNLWCKTHSYYKPSSGYFTEKESLLSKKATQNSHAPESYKLVDKIVYLNPTLENLFKELALKWRMETGIFSTSLQKVNDTYLEIIGKGMPIVPIILKELEKTGNPHWHIALKAITTHNPFPNNDLHNAKKVKEEWVKWGKQKGFI